MSVTSTYGRSGAIGRGEGEEWMEMGDCGRASMSMTSLAGVEGTSIGDGGSE